MIIKRKTHKQARIYNDLFDVYEAKGSFAAWNFASTLVKEKEITEYEANALMKEISMCFDIG